MKLRIANYRVEAKRSAKGTHKLVIQGNTKDVTKLFDDGGVSLDFAGGRAFELVIDPESRYHFGKDISGLRRIEIFHSTSGLEAFGVVEVKASDIESGLMFDIPRKVHAPINRKRSKKKPAPPAVVVPQSQEITLRQAVEAVNRHVDQLGDDLALSVVGGRLKALIEY